MINTVTGTISIPSDKLQDIQKTIAEWEIRKCCTRRQLQSLLGHLSYLHKCVNRMLNLLRSNYNAGTIQPTSDFKRDLRWFFKFLKTYNGVSLYNQKAVHQVLELDACLTALGGRYIDLVYHLPIQRDFRNLSIVHLELVNILLAFSFFG